MITEADKRMMTLDVAELIRMSGQTAEIRRGEPSGAGSFEGVASPDENIVAVVPIEFQQLSPEELKQIGADGICSLLPDADVREGDVLVFGDVRYVATDVRPENCFGAVTHLTVRLEKEYRKRE
jgi:hypothetical protein